MIPVYYSFKNIIFIKIHITYEDPILFEIERNDDGEIISSQWIPDSDTPQCQMLGPF